MNYWQIIYSVYIKKSSRSALFKKTIKCGNKGDNFFLLICLIFFMLGVTLFFIKYEEISFYLIVVGEIGMIYKLDKLKKALVLNEYGDPNIAQTPHDDVEHKTSRYLMFKQELCHNNIAKSHVIDCFDLVETQIDISESAGNSVRTFSNFGFGVLLGILATFWKKLETTDLIYVGLTLLVVGVFIGIVISLFPSRIEKLKEMKYFMQLYCREVTLPDSSGRV